MRPPILLAALAVAVGVPSLGTATTQTPIAPHEVPVSQLPANAFLSLEDAAPPPGSIVMYFRGGQAGANLAAVLAKLIEQPGIVPVEPHRIAAGDTVCGLLIRKGLPEPCGPYLPVVGALNPGTNLAAPLVVGQVISLPNLSLRTQRSTRSFLPAQLAAALRNWRLFNPLILAQGSGSRVEYDSIELRVMTPTHEQQQSAVAALGALGLSNVSIEAVPFQAPVRQPYGRSAETVQSACTDGTLRGHPVNYVEYAFDDDPSAVAVGQSTIVPTVYILDVPLLESPNLSPASQDGSAWHCEWFPYSSRNHSAHLAGIIGSRQGQLGFLGLEPSALIKSREYMGFDGASPSEEPHRLAGRILTYRQLFHQAANGDSLPVFLVASSFRKPEDYTNLFGSRLTSADARFNGTDSAIESAVRDEQPLLIVAAGQDPRFPAGIELDARTPLSPQNLGDLPNVVTVTACDRCARRDAGLMAGANYDSQQRRFVHIAAPGGVPMAGWINQEGIGAASGTSQAAAYVAGVAASMIARFPLRYREAARVKQRLMTTSWPFIDQSGGRAPSWSHLAAGMVDPQLATFDPSLDWLKTRTGWQSVRVRRWLPNVVNFQDRSGTVRARDVGSLLRMIRTADQHFVAFENAGSDDDSNAELTNIRAVDLGTLVDASVQLETCDGQLFRLGDIADFLPRLGGLPGRSGPEGQGCESN